MTYVQKILEKLHRENPHEAEFLQAATGILTALEPVVERNPQWEEAGLLERFVEPERIICFRVPWVDDATHVQVNKGYLVQFNSAIGPYKGGLRFHPSVNLSVLKFLGMEQTLKNSLTSLPMGGGKGGSDFDPKDKSEAEIMRFCQSFMCELYRHLGENSEVPAGDIGVGAREIGYMFGMYKRLKGSFDAGVLTGKGLSYGGSIGRPEATGYGLLFFLREALAVRGESVRGKKIIISGSGNVGIHAAEKAVSMGATVIAMSDSTGYVYNPNGIDVDKVKPYKMNRKTSLADYAAANPSVQFVPDPRQMWQIPCDVALPCATQNELDEASAEALIRGGVMAVCEGANMPSTPKAIECFRRNKIIFAPGKAANAGGVAVSGLEMSQNSQRLHWTKEEVLAKLEQIMITIHNSCLSAAEEYGYGQDYVIGANIAGFLKVADAMMAQGIC